MKNIGPVGVYSIKCSANRKLYIGSSSRGCSQRWWDHKKALRTNTHHSVLLQRAWNKYGEQQFVFEMVEITIPDKAVVREQHYMDLYETTNPQKGFNICSKAGSCRGVIRTDEQRRKMSEAQRRRKPPSDETKRKMSESQRGKKMSPEAIEKTRRAHLGRKYSAEQRRANSERNKGKKLSPQHLQKLIDANRGRVISDDTRKKIGDSNRGKVRSAEVRAKMTGVKRSEDSRKRMSESQMGKKQSPEQIAKRVESYKKTVALRNDSKTKP